MSRVAAGLRRWRRLQISIPRFCPNCLSHVRSAAGSQSKEREPLGFSRELPWLRVPEIRRQAPSDLAWSRPAQSTQPSEPPALYSLPPTAPPWTHMAVSIHSAMLSQVAGMSWESRRPQVCPCAGFVISLADHTTLLQTKQPSLRPDAMASCGRPISWVSALLILIPTRAPRWLVSPPVTRGRTSCAPFSRALPSACVTPSPSSKRCKYRCATFDLAVAERVQLYGDRFRLTLTVILSKSSKPKKARPTVRHCSLVSALASGPAWMKHAAKPFASKPSLSLTRLRPL